MFSPLVQKSRRYVAEVLRPETVCDKVTGPSVGLGRIAGVKLNDLAVGSLGGVRSDQRHDSRAEIETVGAVRQAGAALDATQPIVAPNRVAGNLAGSGPGGKRHRGG